MARLVINRKKTLGHINPEIQGQFSEHLGRGIYEGIFVKEDSGIPNKNGMRTDVVEALKKVKVPLLRWPGGCFADEYHWKDGIGPKEQRKKIVNTNWGGVTEDNSFGTHEFFELTEQLGCKTYVNGNVGSGTVQEMSEWIEYMTFDGVSPMAELRKKNGHEKAWKVDYFGVGNENWGCGGNMTPEYYADLYRRYQTFVRQYDPKKPIKKVCGGPNVSDTFWTEGVLSTCFKAPSPDFLHGFMDGLSLHYYVHPGGWENKGSATDFDIPMYYQSMKKALYIEDLINLHGEILDRYDPEKKIGMIVDEWGEWCDVEPGTNPGFLYQQNTMRDALVAAVSLNIFNNHCDRVKMACLAQMVNVIQSLILTEGDRMILTPTYHVFDMYKEHQDGELLDSTLTGNEIVGTVENPVPALQYSVSEKDGKITLTIANMDLEKEYPMTIEIDGEKVKDASAFILTGDVHDKNTFEEPENVVKKEFDGVRINGNNAEFTIPSCSIVSLQM